MTEKGRQSKMLKDNMLPEATCTVNRLIFRTLNPAKLGTANGRNLFSKIDVNSKICKSTKLQYLSHASIANFLAISDWFTSNFLMITLDQKPSIHTIPHVGIRLLYLPYDQGLSRRYR